MKTDALLRKLGAKVKDGLPASTDEDRLARQRQSFMDSATHAPLPAWYRRRWIHFALVATPVAAAIVIAATWLFDAPLGFSVGPARQQGTPGMWISTAVDESIPVAFAEGTELQIQANTRVQIPRARRKRVDVVLHDGVVTARVQPRTGTTWHIASGPYKTRVVGTRFSLSWSVATSTLAISLQEGTVVVSGPGVGAGVTVQAPSELTAQAGSGRYQISAGAAGAAPPNGAPSMPEPSVSTDETAEPRDLAPERAGHTRTTSGEWRVLALRNDSAAAIAAAERVGLDRLCREGGVDDLWLLADAARYSRNGKAATRVLLAIRERFPRGGHGERTTFLLGRVAVDLRHDPAKAADWFELYLEAYPDGTFAEEALGGLFETLARAGHHDEARAAATRYLNRFPRGVYVDQAKALLAR